MSTAPVDSEHALRLKAGAACRAAGHEYRRELSWCIAAACDPQHVGEGKEHAKSCSSPGKRPVGAWKHLQDRLTTDAEIDGYFDHHPTRNIGMITGLVSMCLVADCDGERGLANFLKSVGLDTMPVTPTSGNSKDPGSLHFHFRLPAGARIRSTNIDDPTAKHNGFSIKAEGGFCVLPPSRKSDGSEYTWQPGLSPLQVPLADLPPEILRYCQAAAPKRDVQEERDGDYPPAKIEPIVERCAFMRHCRDDAAAIGYEEWLAMLQIVARCENGRELAHQLSAPYPGYSHSETDAKFDDVQKNCSPRTCGNIESFSDACRGCVARINGCNSPISLGMFRDGPSPEQIGHRDGLPIRTVGPLELAPDKPRATAAKISVPVDIRRDAVTIDHRTLTSTDSSRKTFENVVCGHLGDDFEQHRPAVEAETAGILIDAREYLKGSRTVTAGAVDVRKIVGQEVRKLADLAFVDTESGKAFDRMAGRMLTRNQFVERFTNNEMLAAAATAVDAPRDENGVLNRSSMVTALKRELELLWGDMVSGLAGVEHADLGPESDAAEKFRAAIIRTWTKLDVFSLNKRPIAERDNEGESVQLMHRGSLIQLVRDAMWKVDNSAGHGEVFRPDAKWTETKPGRFAWYRREVDQSGRPVALLAMRFEMLAQLNIPSPAGVGNHRTFRRLGIKYGVFTEDANVPDRMDRGRIRLAILHPKVVRELLVDPNAGDGEEDDAVGGDDCFASSSSPDWCDRHPAESEWVTE